MKDFTGWYFVFKHFKLQQFNISLSFFVQSDLDVFQLPWIPHIEYRYKSNKFSTNLAQLSKKRTPLISRKLFFAPTVSANWRENCTLINVFSQEPETFVLVLKTNSVNLRLHSLSLVSYEKYIFQTMTNTCLLFIF